MSDWILLIASLPAATKTPRMRLWRALKASGAATLRDGVYLLPRSDAADQTFAAQLAAVVKAGGQAQVLPLAALSAAQEREFRSHFDRSAEYDALLAEFQRFTRGLARESEGSARRRVASLRRDAALLM